MTTKSRAYRFVFQIERDALAQGSHWFDLSSMRFFNTRLGQEVFGGRYFVSSEKYNYNAPRLFTVREVTWEDGRMSIGTVGEFQQYRTRGQAQAAARKLAQGVK